MTTSTNHTAAAPGRIGRPDLRPATDPRVVPSLVSAMAAYGLDAGLEPPVVTPDAELDAVLDAVGLDDAGAQAMYDTVPLALPGDRDDVEVSTRTITSFDGAEILLHIFRPHGVDGPLPGIFHTHGGGMTILTTDNQVHRRWDTDLAASGAVVVLVDFRNAWTPESHNPFPTGVEDCLAGLLWTDAHRDELGLSSLVTYGESGGGNLAIAVTLLAKSRGRLDAVDGVYADIPFISGGYHWSQDRKLSELPSLVENDGYQVHTGAMSLIARCYDPTGENAENPIAWPYHATVDDLRGLPPVVVSINELDPLRDEGIAFARKLALADVDTSAKVHLGLTHGAQLFFRPSVPEAQRSAIRDIAGFATDRARLGSA